ncbi:SDR family oxidoreductase [Mycobacterium shigaense]|uniref:Oxidoreductase n=1 Tax=Mycobacterium shigaense TaxID=722731 RepID=A0A1Z4EHT8_9MYCO|nr:SDR family oxidoreductase [Mycobacterium shigaense]MEA1124718.1 SDR family oxidoreductase [Mycobacterium shigaense]PRI14166.1 short-chain dehydrogenase [Mycobacterium shigaense]BAX92533.1 oxidoreductase [Mycobacterium shigaense]
MSEQLDGRTILVTGANGGLGQEFVRQGLTRGARRVYAAARTPRAWEDARVVPITLDLTDAVSVAAAAAAAPDVDILINNAAIAPSDALSVLTGDEEIARGIFETNYFGTVRVTRAFAPVLAAKGGGSILNVLSLSAWTPVPSAYAASKAAAWSATNAIRAELAPQGTAVTGLMVGLIDTAMSADWNMPKVSPASVVEQAYDGIAHGAHEVLADEETRTVKGLLSHRAEDLNAFVSAWLAGSAQQA